MQKQYEKKIMRDPRISFIVASAHDTVDATGHVVRRGRVEGRIPSFPRIGRGLRPRIRRGTTDDDGAASAALDSDRASSLGVAARGARAHAAQAGYIQARGHGSQCDAGCRSRWGCCLAYHVRRALRALTLRSRTVCRRCD